MAITRYAALLRGVSPMNAKMSELRRCFECAGFEDVKTVLGSGNVVFGASSKSTSALERTIERCMAKELEHGFPTIVRPIQELEKLLEADPFAKLRLPAKAKRVVTFLRSAPAHKPALPIELHEARILALKGHEVFSAYVPGPRGPVFMTLIEKTFGKDVTTRTWDTVRKIVAAGAASTK